MIFFFICVLLAVFSTILHKNRKGLLFSFFVIFIFLAFRFEYGNDYKNYHELFYDINLYFNSYLDNPQRLEYGWILLNRTFHPFGFFTLVAFLALINCYTYFKIILRFVTPNYYWFAILLYMIDSYFMLTQLSAIRQTLAFNILILAIIFLFDKKYLKAIICLPLMVFFHSSSIIMIPLLLLFFVRDFKMKYLYIFVFQSLFIFLFVFGDQIKSNLGVLINFVFADQYDGYSSMNIESSASVVNVSIYFILNSVLLFSYNKLASEIKFFTLMTLIGIFVMPIGFIIPLSARIALYLLPFSILVYPAIATLTHSKIKRYYFIIFVASIAMVRVVTFLFSDTYNESYKNYESIFNSEYYE